MNRFSPEEKREFLMRELRIRQRAFETRVLQGGMTQAQAEHELALLEAVLADYEAAALPGSEAP